jgi:hypothetical protein
MKIAPITSNGTIEMTFTHKMLHPLDKIPPSLYNKVFGVAI